MSNRPFPSSKNFHLQNEAKCKAFLMKMNFICMRMKNHFPINGFTLGLTYGLSHLKIAHDLILGPDCIEVGNPR